MIISENWLREWVGLDLDAQAIADCLTAAGLEVDGVVQASEKIDKLLVGRVLEVTKHPDADRLNLTKVDIGSEQLDIVCGASNVRPDLMVAVATVGAKLPNGLKIKKAKVRGAESFGMLCSAAELGLEESSDGLLELDADAEIGQRVDEYLQLDEYLIDIDLTPNRGDCLSVQGIAREMKVLADADYRPLVVEPSEPQSKLSIDIDLNDSVACPRYIGRVIEGIDARAVTPLWMRERLRRCGVRPISAIVDITNYVMLEIGQPMHAFDLAKLQDGIIVRQSKVNEKITLLDDSRAELDGDTLIIADHDGPIAIAGVMGGADSAINDDTSNIVFEAAHFTRSTIAGRARRYGLHTESSHRFERGVDPELPMQAIERASELVLDICGGKAGDLNEQSNPDGLTAKPDVEMRLSRLIKLLGMPLDKQEVADILNRIANQVSETEDGWSVKPPSYRFDIECEADLVEEVARVKGYDNIPVAIPRIAPRSIVASEDTINVRQFKQSLVARDYREVINYSFIELEKQALFSDEKPIELANPLAENMSVMRTSLLPGLLSALQFNLNRQHQRVRLFEVGATYHQHEKNTKASTPYKEVQRLGGVATGLKVPIQWGSDNGEVVDFYDIKADLESLLALTGHDKAIIFKGFQHIAMHPGQVAEICINSSTGSELQLELQQTIGYLGRLHPALLKQYGLSNNTYMFELDLDKALKAKLPEFKSLTRFPSIKRDLSIVIDQDITSTMVTDLVEECLGESLAKMIIFDLYEGKGIESDKKSLSLNLVLQKQDKTMVDEDAENLIQKLLGVLENKLGAILRN